MIDADLDKIIELLHAVRDRPLVYLRAYDHRLAEVFFSGLGLAFSVTGRDQPDRDMIVKAYAQCGWRFNALGAVPEMKSKGLSEQEIVHEIVAAEIIAWELLRSGEK